MTTTEQLLDRLVSPNTALGFDLAATTGAKVEFLWETGDPQRLRALLQSNALAESLLEDVLRVGMSAFRTGVQFPFQAHFSVAALALLHRKSDFADRFFTEFGSLQIKELANLSRVVRAVRRKRITLTTTRSRDLVINQTSQAPAPSSLQEAPMVVAVRAALTQRDFNVEAA